MEWKDDAHVNATLFVRSGISAARCKFMHCLDMIIQFAQFLPDLRYVDPSAVGRYDGYNLLGQKFMFCSFYYPIFPVCGVYLLNPYYLVVVFIDILID